MIRDETRMPQVSSISLCCQLDSSWKWRENRCNDFTFLLHIYISFKKVRQVILWKGETMKRINRSNEGKLTKQTKISLPCWKLKNSYLFTIGLWCKFRKLQFIIDNLKLPKRNKQTRYKVTKNNKLKKKYKPKFTSVITSIGDRFSLWLVGFLLCISKSQMKR